MVKTNDNWHRRSLRLPGYDYTLPGAYFVTLVAKDRECLFGSIDKGLLTPTPVGSVVIEEMLQTPGIRPEVEIDAFFLMPNHIHAIIVLNEAVGAHSRAPLRPPGPGVRPVRPPRSLGSLIAGFKAATTKRINALRASPGVPVWQRNYYDHIIRNATEWNRIREYIVDNPARWDDDPENPSLHPSQ